jgi:predicted transcriptional regulator
MQESNTEKRSQVVHVRVDSDLKRRFDAAISRDPEMTAARKIRELMRAFVEKSEPGG